MANDKNSIYVITDLILENTRYGEDERILLMSAASVDLLEAIASIVKELHVYDSDYRSLNRLRNYVRDEHVYFYTDVYPPAGEAFDTAILFVPKGRDVARAQLWSAAQAVKEGGEIIIAGPTKGGAKTMISDAEELLGNMQVLDYKRRHRVASITNTGVSEYPAAWGADPTQLQFSTFDTPLGSIEVATMPGVFSWDELDEGTAYLLEHLDFRDAQRVLDVGCGTGIIGALAAQHVEHVTMVDNDLLAVRCAMETVKHNGLANVEVIASDVYSSVKGEVFDLIVSNPPFHRGFEVNTHVPDKLIRYAPTYLKSGGRLLLVANEFLKYESIFSETFSRSGVNAKNNKYKIMEGS